MLNNFVSFIEAGGPVMYPLTLLGVMIFVLGIYQIGWLAAWTLKSDLYACAGAPMWAKKAIALARHQTGFSGLTILESIELCFSRLEDCLTRRVPTMRFMAQISTLLGFLGTVTGMVRVFNTVSQLGTVTPADLAGGIHEALFTTVYGLILAIIAWGLTYCIEALSRRHLRHLELLVINELEKTTQNSTPGVADAPQPEK